jgi:tight adherence protein C
MNRLEWIPVVIALMAGGAVAAIGWLVSQALADVPDEDRSYKDPPPWGFRVVWWPIQWVAFYVGPLMPASMRERLQTELRKAGLDYCLSPEQFAASRIVCAGAAGLFVWWLVDSYSAVMPALEKLNPGGVILIAGLGLLFPRTWLSDRIKLRGRDLAKSLPFFLDIITLCVEAGLNLHGAMQQAVQKGPKGVLRDELQRVLRDIRAGKPRAQAFRHMAERLKEPSITNLVATIIQAEAVGMNLGPVLRAQADQRRSERFLRAEKLAMEAPVKMLFPLLAFIFPSTFLVLGFPIAMKFLDAGF